MPMNKEFVGNANNLSSVEAPSVRIFLDHHYPNALVKALRDSGIDAVNALELGMQSSTDEEILEYCRRELRAVLTNNHGDFAQIARDWSIGNRTHSGILYTSDSSLPRTIANTTQIVRRVELLIATIPPGSDLQDQQRWL
jgi:predicted nuclease of predicted toxin-antitoxin system